MVDLARCTIIAVARVDKLLIVEDALGVELEARLTGRDFSCQGALLQKLFHSN